MPVPPFLALAPSLPPQSALPAALPAAHPPPRPEWLPPLARGATLPPATRSSAAALARRLIGTLREKSRGRVGVEALIQEYSLSSEEGVALMCLAEALLRIPDDETRDALIRDKIGGGDWRSHLG